jgi:hypothetical protein
VCAIVGLMTASIVPPEGEHLVDGWEPDLPVGDTLVRQAVHVLASWSVEVARSAGRPWHAGSGWAAGWIGDRGALTNPVVLLRPPTDLPAVLQEIDSLFPAKVPYLLVCPWRMPQLRQHGLALLGHPPLMARLPGTAPDAAAAGGPSAPSVRVRPVRDAQELALAERVLVDGYPMPDLEPLAVGDLLGPSILQGTTRVWLAWLDERPVAVAATHQNAGVSLVEYVATLPDARGLGAGSAVTWAATTAEPDQPAVLLASDDGRPVYERMGYQAIERWSAWLRPGG